MENTLENKAKFFAHYFGQKVLNIGLKHLSVLNYDYLNPDDVNENHLELKPLQSITDEDVLKIAESILWRNTKISESAMIAQTKDLLLQTSKIFTIRSE